MLTDKARLFLNMLRKEYTVYASVCCSFSVLTLGVVFAQHKRDTKLPLTHTHAFRENYTFTYTVTLTYAYTINTMPVTHADIHD